MNILSRKLQWHYFSKLDLTSCMQALTKAPLIFGDNPFNLESYKYMIISETQMYITFTGSRFSKRRQTEYLCHFSANPNGTDILLEFKHELWGFPLPYTPIYLVDQLMLERLQARRIDQ